MHLNYKSGVALIICVMAFAGTHAQGGTAANKARLLMNAGVAHERLGRNEEAVADFTQALAMKTLSREDSVRAIYDRGVALDALGKTKGALADYAAAIRLKPNFAPALNNRANAYRRLGRLAEAKRDYLAALASGDAAREYSYYGLGQIARQQGDFVAARDYYRKALDANPAYALAAQSLGELHDNALPSLVLRAPPAKHGLPAPKAVAANEAPKPVPVRAPPKPAPVPAQPSEADLLLRKAILDSRTKTASIAPVSPAKPSAEIQLGAFRDGASATAAWNVLVGQSGGALAGLEPRVVPVDLPGKGRFWRLRAGLGSPAEAKAKCAALAARGLACLVPRD